MDDSELFEGCTKLSDIAASRLDMRRQWAWRLNLGIWAVLVAGIAYFRVDQLPVGPGLIALMAHGFFVRGVFERNESDTTIIWHFFHQAQHILARHGVERAVDRPGLMIGANLPPRNERGFLIRSFGFLANFGNRFELLVTALLIGVMYTVCTDDVTWWHFARGN